MDFYPPSSPTATVLSTVPAEFDSIRYPPVIDETTLLDIESNEFSDGTRTPGTPPPPPASIPLQSEEKPGPQKRALNGVPPGRQFERVSSAAAGEWERETAKDRNLERRYPAISQLMELVGLEEVKAQVLAIKDKIQICGQQRVNLKKEKFHVIFQGNPGTGSRRPNSTPKEISLCELTRPFR